MYKGIDHITDSVKLMVKGCRNPDGIRPPLHAVCGLRFSGREPAGVLAYNHTPTFHAKQVSWFCYLLQPTFHTHSFWLAFRLRLRL